MAVTSIWPVKSRLDRVINYARNPEKTNPEYYPELSSFHEIDSVLEYAADDMKTEQRKYVSCLNIKAEEYAVAKFKRTQQVFGKTKGRVCYHGYQSFKENEVTAEQAHEIGVELAKTLWGDKYEVVIATHLNTNHLHNHFIINSVSFVDGIKFHNTKEDYRNMRKESDRLCKQYGLSVVKDIANKSKSYSEWQAEKTGKLTQRDTIRRDIDAAIKASYTQAQFITVMEQMGYEFKTHTANGQPLKYPALKPPGAKGFFRFHKLGEGYDIYEVVKRINNNMRAENPFPDLNKPKRQIQGKLNGKYLPGKKYTGLRATYIRYCFELGIIKKYPTSVKRVSFSLREDVIKMDRYMAQSKVLGKYRINTIDELNSVRNQLKSNINTLTTQRKDLRNLLKKAERKGDENEIEKIKGQIADISLLLKEKRKEVKSLDEVEERSAKVKENLQELEKEKAENRLEVKEYEHKFGRSRTAR